MVQLKKDMKGEDNMAAMTVGYARVSTNDQSFDRQLDILAGYGCERIYKEKMTGTKASRPEFDMLLNMLRPGDVLVVESFSRLSRSTKDLLEIVDRLSSMNVHLISHKEQLDTTTATGKLMLTMLSAQSQFERDIIAERTREGLKAARSRGRIGGRKPVGNEKIKRSAMAMYEVNVLTNAEIAKASGVSPATLNRWIAAYKREKN